MRIRHAMGLSLFGFVMVACATTTNEIRTKTAKTWNCPEEGVTVTPLGDGRAITVASATQARIFCARGCGREQTVAYVLASSTTSSRAGQTYAYHERYAVLREPCAA